MSLFISKRLSLSILLMIGISTYSLAQELMVNGSMEDGIIGNATDILPDWESIDVASVVYNSDNNWGWYFYTDSILPQDGDGFSGMATYGTSAFSNPYVRGYLMGETTHPLEAGKSYQVSYWLRPRIGQLNEAMAVDQFGALLTTLPPDYGPDQFFEYTPQITNDGHMLSDTSNWYQVSACYLAQGGERYITLGNFKTDADTNTEIIIGGGLTNGSVAIDNVSIQEYRGPQLPADTAICPGDSFTITMADPDASYLWPDASTGPLYVVDSSGPVFVEVSKAGCTARQEMLVGLKPILEPMLAVDTLCIDEGVVVLAAGSQAESYRWQDNSTDSLLRVTQAGTYWVERSNDCGTVTDSIAVSAKDCSCHLWVPNSFSPDGDGNNDNFLPIMDCAVLDYSFDIYDRLGQVVFSSQDSQQAWSGNSGSGYYAQDGLYTWRLSYRSALGDGFVEEQMGTVMVIR